MLCLRLKGKKLLSSETMVEENLMKLEGTLQTCKQSG